MSGNIVSSFRIIFSSGALTVPKIGTAKAFCGLFCFYCPENWDGESVLQAFLRLPSQKLGRRKRFVGFSASTVPKIGTAKAFCRLFYAYRPKNWDGESVLWAFLLLPSQKTGRRKHLWLCSPVEPRLVRRGAVSLLKMRRLTSNMAVFAVSLSKLRRGTALAAPGIAAPRIYIPARRIIRRMASGWVAAKVAASSTTQAR